MTSVTEAVLERHCSSIERNLKSKALDQIQMDQHQQTPLLLRTPPVRFVIICLQQRSVAAVHGGQGFVVLRLDGGLLSAWPGSVVFHPDLF